MSTLYIVYKEEDADTPSGIEYVINRIFTSRAETDKYMLSQTWWLNRCYRPERFVLSYKAVCMTFAEDGTILSEETIDYSAHAPPTPTDEGRAKACGIYIAKKMLDTATHE